ncbi:hypothetical protein RI367_003203 [Sorochytrium milnesiophthora]
MASETAASTFYENFFELLAHITSLALTDQERERVIQSLHEFHETLKRVSSRNLKMMGEMEKPRKVPLCKHPGTCTQSCVRGWVKSFMVGYVVKYVVGIAPGLLTGKTFKRPSLLLREFNQDTLQFALFLSTFASSYKALLCAIRHATDSPTNKAIAFIAGAVAGLSVLIDKNKTRRTTLCLYFLTKSGQFGCRWAVQLWEAKRLRDKQARAQAAVEQLELDKRDNGIVFSAHHSAVAMQMLLPTKRDKFVQWLKRHAGTMVMMGSSAQILFSFVAMPETLAKSYYSFLVSHSGIRDRMGPLTNHYMTTIGDVLWGSMSDNHVDAPRLAVAGAKLGAEGGHLHKAVMHNAADLGGLLAASALSKKDFQYRMCALIHPETPSCTAFSLRCFTRAMRRSAALYAPLNAIMVLVFNWRKVIRRRVSLPPHYSLLRYLLSTLRSSVFLSVYVTVAWLATCYQRRLTGVDRIPTYYINGMLSGLCVLIETYPRRLELGLYCLPRALEAFWRCLMAVGVVRRPNRQQILPVRLLNTVLTKRTVGEPVYFALAMGLLMMLYETEEDALTDGYRTMMVRFFGVN